MILHFTDTNDSSQMKAVTPESPLPVTSTGGGNTAASDIVSVVKTVADADTPEALVESSTACLWVYVEAPDTDVPPGPLIAANSGNVWIGGDDGPPHKLAPGQGMGFGPCDLADLVVRVASDGEGVVFTYGVSA